MIDPITLEIVEGSVESAVTEIEAAVERTSMSSMMREQHDFRVAIYDAECSAISRVSFAATIDPIYEVFGADGIREGDVVLYNDVYRSHGGITHLPDICVNVPVFWDDEIVAWVQCYGHVEDIGGIATGSMPLTSTEIYHEGLMIPPVKLYDAGKVNDALYTVILRNSRFPESLRGDIDAEIAACRLGAERLQGLCGRYGKDTVAACFARMLQRCADGLREHLLPQIADGSYSFEDFIGHDFVNPERSYTVKLTMEKSADRLKVNFDGTSSQAEGPINFAATPKFYAKLLGSAFKPHIPDLVLNEGVSEVFELEAPPEGSVLNPRFPAPVAHRSVSMVRVLDTFQGLMAKALPGRTAAAMDTLNLLTIHGARDDGSTFFFREIIGAGSGGRHFAEGLDAVDMVPESKNAPTEFVENVYPIEIVRCALRQNSGGAGRYRGGAGYEKDFRILCAEVFLSIRGCRTRFANWGIEGGMAGETAKVILNPETNHDEELTSVLENHRFVRDDVVRIVTAGGGGWGDPLDRPAAQVAHDVLRKLISEATAHESYGVILDPITHAADDTATESLRGDMKSRRGVPPRFGRGDHAEQLRAEGKIAYAD